MGNSMASHENPFIVDSIASYQEYDICVITAANDYQAQGYRKQLQWRKDKGELPERTEFFVFADPKGRRIGSGGSTIYVLYRLLEHFCKDGKCWSPEESFQGKRILILHSGGDSKRLPAYSAVGKVFTPLPTSLSNDGFVALFDLLLNNLVQLPYQEEGQIVIAAGDVLLSFDASEVAFSDSGVTGLAYPGSVEVASGHGVYIAPQTLTGENPREVVDFLQKPTYDELKQANGLDSADRAFVDTGVMNFSLDSLEVLMDASGISLENGEVVVRKDSLCEALINADIQLDIYREFPFAMLGKSEPVDLLTHRLIDSLAHVPFSVSLLPYCEFFHVGTSRKLIQNFHTINYTASIYGFQNFSKTKAPDKSALGDAFVYNSLINTHSMRVSGPALIEGCCLEGRIQLNGENILTGIPRGVGDIELQKGICVTCVPIAMEQDADLVQKINGWASVIYGIEDDFKRDAENDGATFLNRVFASWMNGKGISPTDLWVDGEPHDLWNAKLFPFSASSAESMQIALNLQTKNSSLALWIQSPRMSLQEILRTVDYERFLDNCSTLSREISLGSLATTLTSESDLSSEEILSWCVEPDDYTAAAKTALALVEQSEDILFQARLYKLLSNIIREADNAGCSIQASSIEYEDKVFELIRKAVRKGLQNAGFTNSLTNRPIDPLTHKPIDPRIQIRSDEVVWVCAPARLDFAGGWSDTPPYCLEHGGSVLNTAVTLNGQYPIQAIGKLHPEPFIRINSIDLGERVIISETPDMLSYQDPSNWSALPKAAFVAAGIIPEDKEFDLQDILRQLGSGIDLTLFSAVPAGSGLGTSSILGSAIIACLSRMIRQELAQEDLFSRTLYMEQLMTTGGGWQDQIGGVVGGVKLIQTEPGLFQVPRISWTDLRASHDMDLSERFLLYYTGYRRMARNILRNVVGKYLDRDAVLLRTLLQLQEKSLEMKEDLDRRNIDAFGAKIGEVWELNKTLDPGTSNEDIEAILGKISHLVHGAKLLGAGGGGFFFMVTKGKEETQKLKQILTDEPPNSRARFFDFDVDPDGLKVSVL